MTGNAFICAGILLVLLLLGAAPLGMADERGSSDELMVLASWLEFDQGNANGLSSSRYFFTREQTLRQNLGVLTSFALIDYAQTVAMLYGSEGYYEINPILGAHPSRGTLVAFGLIGSGLFYVIGRNLPDPWKQIFVDSVLTIERLNIEDNRRLHRGWNTDGPPIRGRSFNGIPIIISLRF